MMIKVAMDSVVVTMIERLARASAARYRWA